eukprot:6490145-Prymnesium_polylepis.1
MDADRHLTVIISLNSNKSGQPPAEVSESRTVRQTMTPTSQGRLPTCLRAPCVAPMATIFFSSLDSQSFRPSLCSLGLVDSP